MRVFIVSLNLQSVKCNRNSILVGSKAWQDLVSKKEAPVNVLRWYNFIQSQPAVTEALKSLPSEARAALEPPTGRQSLDRSNVGNRAQEGKFVELPGAEMGKVVVRFPPEASGYLPLSHSLDFLLIKYFIGAI